MIKKERNSQSIGMHVHWKYISYLMALGIDWSANDRVLKKDEVYIGKNGN